MEQSEAELFKMFEMEMRDVEHDLTPRLQELVCSVELFYQCHWGKQVPFEQLLIDSHPADALERIADRMCLKARREWHRMTELPKGGELLTCRITKDELPYQVRDKESDEFATVLVTDEQFIAGQFCGISICNFIPEQYLDAAQEVPDDLMTIVNPLGLHILLDNVTIGNAAPDDDKPRPSDIIYVPLHYMNLRVTSMEQENT